MGFRLRRSIRRAPGIRINLSKAGTSLTAGRRGATLNFSKRGTRATIGLPESGINYSTISGPETALPKPVPGGIGVVWAILIAIIVAAVLLSLP